MKKGCKDVIKWTIDYLNRSLKKDVLIEIDSHVSQCEKCRDFLDDYRMMKKVSSVVLSEKIPHELKSLIARSVIERAEVLMKKDGGGDEKK